jgi:hypothetical protein
MVRTALAVIDAMLVVGWTAPTASAATCDDYSNQAAAQRAMDTRDADGDGIYCESLPCPCLKPGDSGGGGGGSSPPATKPKPSCVRPQGVLRLVFSKTKYRHIRQHVMNALGKGWPRVMVLKSRTATCAASCAGSTRWVEWRTWRTSRAARTVRTGPLWARSCADSATAPGSSTPSLEGTRLQARKVRRAIRRPTSPRWVTPPRQHLLQDKV